MRRLHAASRTLCRTLLKITPDLAPDAPAPAQHHDVTQLQHTRRGRLLLLLLLGPSCCCSSRSCCAQQALRAHHTGQLRPAPACSNTPAHAAKKCVPPSAGWQQKSAHSHRGTLDKTSHKPILPSTPTDRNRQPLHGKQAACCSHLRSTRPPITIIAASSNSSRCCTAAAVCSCSGSGCDGWGVAACWSSCCCC